MLTDTQTSLPAPVINRISRCWVWAPTGQHSAKVLFAVGPVVRMCRVERREFEISSPVRPAIRQKVGFTSR